MRKSILFLSFLLYFNSSFSQDKKKRLAKFSEEIPLFLEEINDFLSFKKNKDLSRVLSQFEENINTQKFDSKSIKKIIAVSNKMLEKRLRATPHFSNFLKAINQFSYHQSAIPKFSNWLNVVDNLLEESTTKRLILYFTFTDNFLSSGMLRESRGASWHCSSTDYIFDVELGHPFLSFDKEFDLSCSAKGSTIYVNETKGRYKLLY